MWKSISGLQSKLAVRLVNVTCHCMLTVFLSVCGRRAGTASWCAFGVLPLATCLYQTGSKRKPPRVEALDQCVPVSECDECVTQILLEPKVYIVSIKVNSFIAYHMLTQWLMILLRLIFVPSKFVTAIQQFALHCRTVLCLLIDFRAI